VECFYAWAVFPKFYNFDSAVKLPLNQHFFNISESWRGSSVLSDERKRCNKYSKLRFNHRSSHRNVCKAFKPKPRAPGSEFLP